MILGQQLVRVADEQAQQLKCLVADLHRLIAVPQALIREIEPIIHILHGNRPVPTETNAPEGAGAAWLYSGVALRIHQNSTANPHI